MKPLFSNTELVQLAENSKSISEIMKVAEALRFLIDEHNANISAEGFNLISLMRIRQLIHLPK